MVKQFQLLKHNGLQSSHSLDIRKSTKNLLIPNLPAPAGAWYRQKGCTMNTIQTEVIRLLESGFCQHNHAVNTQGNSVFPGDPSAIGWCLYGANIKAHLPPGKNIISYCGLSNFLEASEEADKNLAPVREYLRTHRTRPDDDSGIAHYNDTHTKEEVIAMLREVWA